MRRKDLPNQTDGYEPSGIYKLPIEDRGKAFKELFSDIDEDEKFSERRLKALEELKGNY